MTSQIPLSITARRPNISHRIDFDDRWDPEEIDQEYTNLKDIIQDQLSRAVMDVDTLQTIYAKKTFTNLFFNKGDKESYETVMDILQNDISPIAGNGFKALTTTTDKELAFKRSNVSGVTINIAGRNPIMFKSNILIDKIGNFINIEAMNVPLSGYDITKSGIPPTSNGNNYQAYYYSTSVSYQGTIDLNDTSKVIGGLVNYSRYEIYLVYRDDIGLTDCLLVREGSEGNISNIYKSYKRIGFFRYKAGGNTDDFIITNGVFIPKHTWSLHGSDIGNSNLSSNDDVVGLAGYLKESCIVEVSTEKPTTDVLIQYNTNSSYTVYGTPSSSYLKSEQTYRMGLIYQNNQYNIISTSPVTDGILYVRKVWFGGLY